MIKKVLARAHLKMTNKCVSWGFFYFVTFLMLYGVCGDQVKSTKKDYEKAEFEEMFLEFQERYDKQYDSKDEYQTRFEV